MTNQLADVTDPTAIAFHALPMSVPMIDLALQFSEIREEIMTALESVAQSGSYTLGREVSAFEEAFANHIGSRHCVGLNSGTSALHLALLCAGVGPGDEVVTVPMTFISTAWSISYVGARPVFVDINPTTLTMDPEKVERCITSRTKALLPVHLYGRSADLDPLLEIGLKHGIPVIEDAAQAHGAFYRSRHAGTMGLSGCFSFYPSKNLGAYGEAGALATDSDEIATRARTFRDHSQNQRNHHAEIGFNYRIDAMQSAVLRVKLNHLDRWLGARRTLAERYLRLLKGFDLRLPATDSGREHAWHLFVLLHPERDRIREFLRARGIETGVHYPVPLHLQVAYRNLQYAQGAFPIAESVARECFSIPLFPEMTIAQQDAVVAALRDALEHVTNQ
jgi:dTDP-4-amino-4,6-dideoxygalactose transaminase